MPTSTLPLWFLAPLSFIFGLTIGSFLNVVIHRIPYNESIIHPGSHCTRCQMPLRPWDNIPLISYALLGGRCRNCRARISPLYPAIELSTGLLFLAIVILHGSSWATIAEMWFASVILALICIDARHELLPDEITYPSFPLAVTAAILRAGLVTSDLEIPLSSTVSFPPTRAALFGAAVFIGSGVSFWLLDLLDQILFKKYFELDESYAEASDSGYRQIVRITLLLGLTLAFIWVMLISFDLYQRPEFYKLAFASLIEAILGALIGGGTLWLLRAIYFYLRGLEGMGLGDIKMIAIIGAFLGWKGAILTLMIGSFIGLVFGIFVALRSRGGLQTRVPFGVCLGIAALLTLFSFE